MGCKDTDFFLTSKFFCYIFAKIFTFLFSQTSKILIFNRIDISIISNTLYISYLDCISTTEIPNRNTVKYY